MRLKLRTGSIGQPLTFLIRLYGIFFWMLIFGFWYFLRYEDYQVPGRAFTVTLIKVIDLALMIYITNYILLPRLFYKKKYVAFVLAFILLVTTSSVLKDATLETGLVVKVPAFIKTGDIISVDTTTGEYRERKK